MNAVRLPVDDARLAANVGWRMSESRRRHMLPGLMALCIVVVDALLVASAFLLAYLARFSIDENLATLNFDRYVRLAVLEAVFATILLATHGLYELEQPQSWPVRLRGIASSSATALVLAITVSYFLGDQAFSR